MIYASPIVDPCSSPVYSCPWRPRLVPVAVEQTNSRNPPFHDGRSSTGQCKRLPYIFPQRGAAWIFLWVHIVSPGLVHNCAAQDNQIRRRARSVPLTCHASTSLDSAQLVLQSTKTKVTHGIHLFGNESHWRCVTSQHPPCFRADDKGEDRFFWKMVSLSMVVFENRERRNVNLSHTVIIYIPLRWKWSTAIETIPSHFHPLFFHLSERSTNTQYTVHGTQHTTKNKQYTTHNKRTQHSTIHKTHKHTTHPTHDTHKTKNTHKTRHTTYSTLPIRQQAYS